MYNHVLDVIFPKSFDNRFRGPKIALYVFYAFTAITLWRSQHHMLSEDGGAQSIATIPLDQYSQGASETIIGIFSLWGLSQLLMGFLYLLGCFRYRSMIPLFYLLIFAEYVGRYFIGNWRSIETAGTAPGGLINLPFSFLAFIMLMMCVRSFRGDGNETL